MPPRARDVVSIFYQSVLLLVCQLKRKYFCASALTHHTLSYTLLCTVDTDESTTPVLSLRYRRIFHGFVLIILKSVCCDWVEQVTRQCPSGCGSTRCQILCSSYTHGVSTTHTRSEALPVWRGDEVQR